LLLGIEDILFHYTMCIMDSVELSYLVSYRNIFSNQIYFIRFFDLLGTLTKTIIQNITLQNKAQQHLGICPTNGLPNSFYVFVFFFTIQEMGNRKRWCLKQSQLESHSEKDSTDNG
jgi:hypothetical protein